MIILGVGAIAAIVGYFLFRKKKPVVETRTTSPIIQAMRYGSAADPVKKKRPHESVPAYMPPVYVPPSYEPPQSYSPPSTDSGSSWGSGGSDFGGFSGGGGDSGGGGASGSW